MTIYANINSTAGVPSVPTDFVTDHGTAIPVANTLNIVTPGGGSQGITTEGSGNTVTIVLSNYTADSTTTTDATPDNSMTIALGAIPGVYTMDINVSAYDLTNTTGAGFSLFAAVRTSGAAATLLGMSSTVRFSDAVDLNLAVAVAVSGNNAIIRVTGINATTVDWTAITFYTFAS